MTKFHMIGRARIEKDTKHGLTHVEGDATLEKMNEALGAFISSGVHIDDIVFIVGDKKIEPSLEWRQPVIVDIGLSKELKSDDIKTEATETVHTPVTFSKAMHGCRWLEYAARDGAERRYILKSASDNYLGGVVAWRKNDGRCVVNSFLIDTATLRPKQLSTLDVRAGMLSKTVRSAKAKLMSYLFKGIKPDSATVQTKAAAACGLFANMKSLRTSSAAHGCEWRSFVNKYKNRRVILLYLGDKVIGKISVTPGSYGSYAVRAFKLDVRGYMGPRLFELSAKPNNLHSTIYKVKSRLLGRIFGGKGK